MTRRLTTRPHDDGEALVRLLDGWRTHKIVVVGDFMLDRYVYGDAERLSPDAPVPVLAKRHEESKPGGAANVCLDLLALRCKVACVGIVGRDEAGRQLKESLRAAGCDIAGLVLDAERPTTVKHNFVGLAQHRHPQKMFRLDEETRHPLTANAARGIIAATRKALRGAAVLCLEDYGKGVLTEEVCRQLIVAARRAGVPVLVDPAAIAGYRKYRGVTAITPNRTEAALATGANSNGDPAALRRMAQTLLTDLQLRAVVLTLDKQGALLQERGRQASIFPTRARAVYDVAGAGDMVLAMLAAARANGASWPQAVQLANVAAGLEVERFGVVPIALDEVLLAVLEQRRQQLGKVRTPEQLVPELAAHRRQNKKIAFTNGCFDILHAGHVSYLRQARREGNLLVVAINSDASIRRIKGPDRPVNHVEDRLMVLSELESIDYLVVFDDDTPMRLLRAIKPDVLVKGGDYRKSEVGGGRYVESYGGRVALVNLVKGRSTTNIIRRIVARPKS